MSHEPQPETIHSDGAEVAALTPVRQLLAAIGIGTGLLLAAGGKFGFIPPPEGLSPQGLSALGVLILMATLWLLEVAPLAATSLLPLFLLPLLGIQDSRQVATSYGDPAILLLMGSFFVARSLEHWRVADSLAATVVRRSRGSPVRLMAGLAAATAALSMFMSNTVCALVMGTVALAAIRGAAANDINPEGIRDFTHAVLLGVAFASSIGGMLTPIGTPPNIILVGQYQRLLQDAEPISFVSWMIAALPVGIVLVPALLLTLAPMAAHLGRGVRLGASPSMARPLGVAARRSLVIFGGAVLLWLFRADLVLGPVTIPGWSGLIGVGGRVDDATVAMTAAFLLFAIPSGTRAEARARLEQRGEAAGAFAIVGEWYAHRLLNWRIAVHIPWNVLLLFGGGLALGSAIESSGVSGWLAGGLDRFEGAPALLAIAAVALLSGGLTQVTSNTAITTILLPVAAAAGRTLGVDPHVLMWTVALSASLAFILPTATPANAIVQGLGDIPTGRMARTGAALNVIAVVVVSLVATFWLPLVWRY